MMHFRLPQRVLTVVFCGTAALAADVCGGLPIRPPEASSYLDPPRSFDFRLSVKSGGPAFRVKVRPLLLKWQVDSGGMVHAGDIEISRCEDGKQSQVLPLMAWQPINFGASFEAQDIDFDGLLDFSVLTEFAAKWGSRSYWAYDPESGQFVENDLTRELSRNCLGAEWHGGCWKSDQINFDPIRREISAHYFAGVGKCGGPVDRYRLERNRLIVVHKEVLDMKPDACTITVSDLSRGIMRVTEVRRFDARGEPLK
ncbi:MAG TPA: hypothetical protein VJN43_16635 [Bryobacteraceae bacterium]|nr:hypothetical protein [Bryobacteraceae bacterium]